jgi:DNA-binding CsgD family transcriptional regulator
MSAASLHASSDALIAAIYGTAITCPLERFKEDALKQLTTVLPFASAAWGSGVLSTNTMHSLTIINQPNEMLWEYVTQWQDQDYCRNAAVASPGRAFSNGLVQPMEVYRRTDIYLRFSKRWQIEDALTIVQPRAGLDLAEIICLFRGDIAACYTPGEAATLERIAPHLAAAWNHAQITHHYRHGSRGQGLACDRAGGYAVLTHDGLIQAAGDDFTAAMRAVVPNWSGPYLPEALAPLLDGSTTVLCLAGFRLLRRPAGDCVLLWVDAEQGARNALTYAELRAAQLYADGLTQKAIAQRLGLSQSTIRNQLASAYAKLGCHSKVELARTVGAA